VSRPSKPGQWSSSTALVQASVQPALTSPPPSGCKPFNGCDAAGSVGIISSEENKTENLWPRINLLKNSLIKTAQKKRSFQKTALSAFFFLRGVSREILKT